MLVQELRGEIAQQLASTIAIRRNSILAMGRKAEFDSPYLVSESEVDEFIVSNPLYEQTVVQLLWLPPGLNPAAVSVDVDDEWLASFRSATSQWMGTNSWLAADEPWAAVGLRSSQPFDTRELWTPGRALILANFSLAPATIRIAARLIEDERDLSDLSWRQFEELVADLLDAEGWTVRLTPLSGDGGVDVLAAREDSVVGPILTVWQAKKSSLHRRVGISTIRELITVREEQQASKAFIVTTSILTKGALYRFAQERYRLGAMQGPDLRSWVRRVTGM
jgi:hypothetical protein